LEQKYEDLRAKRTKKLLRQGLTELMLVKHADEITVKELTAHVNVSRGSFYKYYNNIPDMVRQTEEKFKNDFRAIVDKPINDDSDIYPRPMLIYLFVFFRENADLCLVFLGHNKNSAFLDDLIDIVRTNFLKTFEGLIKKENQTNLEYFCSFVSGGSISLFERWIKMGMKETPGEMAELTINLLLHAYKVLL